MKILKTILLLLIIPLSGILGFVSIFAIGFGGGPAIASYMVIATTLAIWIFIIALTLKKHPAKTLWKYLGIYTAACLLIIAAYQINSYYIDSIPVLSTELDLTPYAPFQENTKAVALASPATLKLQDHLPIMDGATALYPLYSAFAKATYPKKDYKLQASEVMCNNTPNAYTGLIDGSSDIIFVARPSQQQLDYAKSKGVELVLTPIGKEAFVFFVNVKNKVNGLSLDQIRRIYTGEVKNWSQLGGGNGDIRAFQRPEGSGSQTMLIHVLAGHTLTTPETNDRPSGMGGIIKETADYKNFKTAIGFSFLYYTTEMVKNKEIKVLDINGIQPNRKTIQDGTYPLTADFYAVTTTKATANTRTLIEWILGPQGQSIIEKTGYTPLRQFEN